MNTDTSYEVRCTRLNHANMSWGWKPYNGVNGRTDTIKLSNINDLARLFAVEGRDRSLAMLQCLGAFHDEEKKRYGFVYQVPKHIAHYQWKSTMPTDLVSGLRKPAFLSTLMGRDKPFKPSPIVDLGTRFTVAKKLAQNLYVLHTSGWIHKKLVHVMI